MNLFYEINSNNEVLIFSEASEHPFLIQPFDPHTKSNFQSIEEASSWAESYIARWYASLSEQTEIQP